LKALYVSECYINMRIFTVGPSKITEKTKEDLAFAATSGIAEVSHRGEKFTEISKQAIEGLKKYLKVPENYKIFYVSSATDAMQSSIANCCMDSSFHFVNGAFSKRFYNVSKAFNKKVFIDEVELGKQNDFIGVNIPDEIDFIAMTHNETSTGVMCTNEEIIKVKEKYPDKILAVDITSSAACLDLPISKADLWFYSVQKGFGLPAGLGILIVSPAAFEKAMKMEEEKKNKAGLFSFSHVATKLEDKYFTIQTPNTILIYALARKLERWNTSGGIKRKEELSREKYSMLEEIIKKSNLEFFVKDKDVRSFTTLCLSANEDIIEEKHKKAELVGILLGRGYGDLKTKTIRIANFPAINTEDIKELKKVFN